MRIVEHLVTEFNDVDVWERHGGYDFEVAGGTHATWADDRIMTGYAWDAIAAGALLRPGAPPRSILMLGLGGGTAVRQLRRFLPLARITAVEIDPGMIDLARRYMHLDELDVDVVSGDAYAYVADADALFDVVIDDVYLGAKDDVVRPADGTAALMQRLRARTTPGGAVLANLVTGAGHERVRRQFRQVLQEAFPSLRVVRSAKGFNETIVGGNALAGTARLREFDTALTHPRDLQLWQALRVDVLPSSIDRPRP